MKNIIVALSVKLSQFVAAYLVVASVAEFPPFG
jgi:hypothetical protein